MPRERYLIIKIVALGDVAVTTVLLSRIRAEHPSAHVTWLCGQSAAAMVRLFPVDEVLPIDEVALLRGSRLARARAVVGAWRMISGRRFDRVLIVHADRRYRILAWPVRAARVSALKHGVNPLLGRFRGDEYARLLDDSAATGPITRRFPFSDLREHFPTRAPGQRARPLVAIAPGGARNVLREDALRRWPVHMYAELAAMLVAAKHDVMLIGDEHDAALRPHFAHLPHSDRMGRQTLPDLLATLREVDLVVTHDTGPLHFARLVRTPVVALFGPTEPRQMVGDADDVDVLWGGSDLACRPCYDGLNYAACQNNVCIQSVNVVTVFEQVRTRLALHTLSDAAIRSSHLVS